MKQLWWEWCWCWWWIFFYHSGLFIGRIFQPPGQTIFNSGGENVTIIIIAMSITIYLCGIDVDYRLHIWSHRGRVHPGQQYSQGEKMKDGWVNGLINWLIASSMAAWHFLQITIIIQSQQSSSPQPSSPHHHYFYSRHITFCLLSPHRSQRRTSTAPSAILTNEVLQHIVV